MVRPRPASRSASIILRFDRRVIALGLALKARDWSFVAPALRPAGEYCAAGSFFRNCE
jgi:hypothetical protein